MTNFAILNTVSVVQLVERQIVVLVVVGSSPTVHPPLRSCIARSLFFIRCRSLQTGHRIVTRHSMASRAIHLTAVALPQIHVGLVWRAGPLVLASPVKRGTATRICSGILSVR